MLVGFAYTTELFIAWYSGNIYERFTFYNRAFGPYAWAYWLMVTCNVVVPQVFWIKRNRRNVVLLFAASLLVNVGMWFERFNIVVISLHRDYLPSSWSMYVPTLIEVGILLGSFGLFFTCFLLFIRVRPCRRLSRGEAHPGSAAPRAPCLTPSPTGAEPKGHVARSARAFTAWFSATQKRRSTPFSVCARRGSASTTSTHPSRFTGCQKRWGCQTPASAGPPSSGV